MSNPDTLGRARMTLAKRVDLLEKDREDQSRVLTALVESSKSFTDEQMKQMRSAMADVLADAGLRVESDQQQDEARKDFMFLRWLRTGVNGLAAAIGWLVIAAFVGGTIWLVNAGLNAWRAM
ncbi:hypothetical protein [Devosia sp. Root635]|uniref:hypothetical protein n=1 Tax=Devosia sp. Root635 TaxID=1736575 RepID=UPI0006F62FAD|nr:hypothetical protein [Devosia sp. Root635]KRA42081.1 hypothetical protein ASD80_10160 [Devosia sp. Root635]